jgi:hypothetical protein
MPLRNLGLLACSVLLAAAHCDDGGTTPIGSSDPCDPSPCFAGVRCEAEDGHPSCAACPAGMEGDGVTCADEDGCAEDPCFPGVACTDVPAPGTGATCGECPDGTVGDGRECEVRGCATRPCFPLVHCTDLPGSGYACGPCPDGFEGDGRTCTDIDGCAVAPCFPGAPCTDVPAPGTGATCGACPSGTEGDGITCTDVDGCAGARCFEGVECTDRPAPETGFTCGPCPPGLEGDGATCTEIDGCAVTPCFPDVFCKDVGAPGTGRTCGPCPPGTAGDGAVCTDLDGCLDDLCVSRCVDVPAPDAGYTCEPCMGEGCPVLAAIAGPDVDAEVGTKVLLRGSATGANGWSTCSWTNDLDANVLGTCDVTVTVAGRTGTYTLTVTDASGAVATDTVAVRRLRLSADAGPDVNAKSGDKVTLAVQLAGGSCAGQKCVTCRWSLRDGTNVSDSCSFAVTATATTNYAVKVTDGGDATVIDDDLTVFVTDVAEDACKWSYVGFSLDNYPYGRGMSYSCSGSKLRHTSIGGASAVVSTASVRNARVTAYVSVESGNGQRSVGLVFGWQDPVHFYLLDWRGASEDAGPRECGGTLAGFAVKRVDGGADAATTLTRNQQVGYDFTDYTFACADIFTTDRGNDALLGGDSEFLLSPADEGAVTTGWAAFTTYRLELYLASDRFKVMAYADDAEAGAVDDPVAAFTIEDDSYPEGQIGIFDVGQLDAYFKVTSMASLSGFVAKAGSDVTIAAGETAKLSGSASLAVPPFTCAWSGGGKLVASDCETSVSPAVTTKYQLTVTDDFGNTATDEVQVAVK